MTARFCLISIGSRGDVAPFIAVGQALRGAGHEGVLVVLEPWRDLVEAASLDCPAMGGGITRQMGHTLGTSPQPAPELMLVGTSRGRRPSGH